MSAKPSIDITIPAEKFEPIDPKTYQWEPGKTVRNGVNYAIALDRKNHGRFVNFIDCDFLTGNFSLTVVKPITFNELRDLTENAIREFAKSNANYFKGDSDESRKALIKDLYSRLFAYWYKEFLVIKLIDIPSFEQAKAEVEKNDNGNHSG